MEKTEKKVDSQIFPSDQEAIYQDEIDLRELFFVVWNGKWIIVGVTLVAAVISIVVALSLPNIYRAEALLAPASGEESGGLGALASQYGGLASLAGINLGGLSGGGDKTALGLEVLQSRKFLGEFIERRNIVLPLLAVNNWDSEKKELRYDDSLYDLESQAWVRSKPSLFEAYERFTEILSVSRDAETGFVELGIDHYAPHLAKQWLDWLVEDLNSEIKNQEVSEAERSIGFLYSQLEATPLTELQTIFYQLIEEQTKTIMLANARSEYLFRTIDPAIVPERKFKPRRALICVFGTMLGGVLGLLLVSIMFIASKFSDA